MIGSQIDTPAPPLTEGFPLPEPRIDTLLHTLGIKLFARERPLSQYVDWSIRTGLIDLLGQQSGTSAEEILEATRLSDAGIDSLLGVLRALGIAKTSGPARFTLTPVAREYLLKDSPYYIGDQLRHRGLPMPHLYFRKGRFLFSRSKLYLMRFHPGIRFGSATRLRNQHARNLAPSAAAVKTGEFADVKCMVDVAGGSGTFSIPFALEHPRSRVVLAELPSAIRNIDPILRAHRLEERIERMSFDAFSFPWTIPECDGIFIGSFLHAFNDDQCIRLCKAGFSRLNPGGRLWIHEMLWNDTRDGPLITALWHAAMRGAGPGRQRTAEETRSILIEAGFEHIRVTPTCGPFSLVSGRRPTA